MKIKRALSLLLSILMIASTFAVTANAQTSDTVSYRAGDTESTGTLKQAMTDINKAGSGYVNFNSDVTADYVAVVEENVSAVFNGNNTTFTSSATNGIYLEDGAELTMGSGGLEYIHTGSGTALTASDGSTVNVVEADVKVMNDDVVFFNTYVDTDVRLNISDSSFTVPSALVSTGYGDIKIELSNVTVNTTNANSFSYPVIIWDGNVCTVKNAFEMNSANGSFFFIHDGGLLDMSSCTTISELIADDFIITAADDGASMSSLVKLPEGYSLVDENGNRANISEKGKNYKIANFNHCISTDGCAGSYENGVCNVCGEE
ncbi:MAG: hypothetical protein E7583_04125, partial [Ruminococcaceae bacterium]|nr:hypothetical protein [Oscillospiraceae bacterium]